MTCGDKIYDIKIIIFFDSNYNIKVGGTYSYKKNGNNLVIKPYNSFIKNELPVYILFII